jgi:hypothetical protein
MNSYDFEIVKKNIFHELNKMLVSLSKEESILKNISPYYKATSSNEMVQYYLQFPLKTRELMSSKLGMSERSLHRIYEDPIKILDDHKILINLSHFLSYSYPYIIKLFFMNSVKSDFKNRNDSIIMKEIIAFEEERSIEERRDIARVLHLILSLKISTNDFSKLNFKLIHNKFYSKENLKRILNFIENN